MAMSTASNNIIHQGVPSRTALRVAVLRAVHQLLDEPIVFNDPFALPILGKKLASEVSDDPFQYNDPLSRGLRASLVARSMFAEEGLRKAMAEGVKQYVILGAGLDTFALRHADADDGLHVYEVDHPSTQEWKKALLHETGIATPQSLTFVPVDFETKSLPEGLREAGIRMDQPVYFSWLGVTMYLTREAIFETLRFVASLPKGSAITFDYSVERSLLDPIARMISEFLGNRIAEYGEPWISFFDPAVLEADVRKLGFSQIDNYGPDDLNPRYFYRRKDGLRAGSGSRWMRAQV
jgi:methyltransferase (TIGR00027 family)